MTSLLHTEPEGYFSGASPSFLDAMTEGMHTLAQPLTVLRATLEIASGNATSVSHYQHAIDTSLAEIERVTQAMGYVQELVRIARDASQASTVNVAAIVELVQEDLQCVFESAGVQLNVHLPMTGPPALISPARLRQCLFHLLQHAVKQCGNGGLIDVFAGQSGEAIQIVLQTTTSRLSQQRCDRREGIIPCLALAETLVKLYGGRLEWQESPFMSWLTLPIAEDSDQRGIRPGTISSFVSNRPDRIEETA